MCPSPPPDMSGWPKIRREDEFLVRFISFGGQELVLGKVASTCTPHENFVNPNAMMIESCGPKSSDVYLGYMDHGRKEAMERAS